MVIISWSIWGSFQGWGSFRGRDHFGGLYQTAFSSLGSRHVSPWSLHNVNVRTTRKETRIGSAWQEGLCLGLPELEDKTDPWNGEDLLTAIAEDFFLF